MSGTEDSNEAPVSRCACGCGCKRPNYSSFSSYCSDCVVGACGDNDPCTCDNCGVEGIWADMKSSRGRTICAPRCRVDIEADAKEAAENEAEYQREIAAEIARKLATDRPRILAAKAVAANWRLRKRLPCITSLARELGLIKETVAAVEKDYW